MVVVMHGRRPGPLQAREASEAQHKAAQRALLPGRTLLAPQERGRDGGWGREQGRGGEGGEGGGEGKDRGREGRMEGLAQPGPLGGTGASRASRAGPAQTPGQTQKAAQASGFHLRGPLGCAIHGAYLQAGVQGGGLGCPRGQKHG